MISRRRNWLCSVALQPSKVRIDGRRELHACHQDSVSCVFSLGSRIARMASHEISVSKFLWSPMLLERAHSTLLVLWAVGNPRAGPQLGPGCACFSMASVDDIDLMKCRCAVLNMEISGRLVFRAWSACLFEMRLESMLWDRVILSSFITLLYLFWEIRVGW